MNGVRGDPSRAWDDYIQIVSASGFDDRTLVEFRAAQVYY
jgi:hypothetical protein